VPQRSVEDLLPAHYSGPWTDAGSGLHSVQRRVHPCDGGGRGIDGLYNGRPRVSIQSASAGANVGASPEASAEPSGAEPSPSLDRAGHSGLPLAPEGTRGSGSYVVR
jgi:hypothetical protein